MKPIEREVLRLFAEEKVEDLDFDFDKRLGNYIYSTWARWEVALYILEGGVDGMPANKIAKGAQLSQRGCNHILDVMVAEGWAEHKCCTHKPCRSKYHTLVASPKLRKFWSGYTDYWVKRMKTCFVLKAHI
tara:strand:- start:6 stop:398 length:393 start_codon:yes stop_codon:yes gene_type:complete